MTFILSAHLVGRGIGPLAAASSLIRNGDVPRDPIAILEVGATADASFDASVDPLQRYSGRGGWMLTTANNKCARALFKIVPALGDDTPSVVGQRIAFNKNRSSHAMGRLVDRGGARHRIPRPTRHDRSVWVRFEVLTKAFE